MAKNGDETGVDCGGSCPMACPVGQGCAVQKDCAAGTLCTAAICSPPETCRELAAKRPGAPSGVYTIDVDGVGPETPFPVYCEMGIEGGGWTSVYKLSAHIGGPDPYTLWTSPTPINESDHDCTSLTIGAVQCVNRVVTKFWNQNGIFLTDARVNVYRAGSNVAFAKFSVGGTSKLSWFSQNTLVSSPWTDLSLPNFFSIDGDAVNGRRWFVNASSGGCPNDTGWLAVDMQSSACTWDHVQAPALSILYSNETTRTNWNNAASVGSADTFVVFVR
jgi:hypothetical protein